MHGKLPAVARTFHTFRIRWNYCCTKCLKRKPPAKSRFQTLCCPAFWNSFKSFPCICRRSSNVHGKLRSHCGRTSSRRPANRRSCSSSVWRNVNSKRPPVIWLFCKIWSHLQWVGSMRRSCWRPHWNNRNGIWPKIWCDSWGQLVRDWVHGVVANFLWNNSIEFISISDPNDVESPRTSFVMGNKLHLSQQNAPVSPNAEDLSLILGSMARGRSFSTTINPKMGELTTPSSSLPQSMSTNPPIKMSSSVGSSMDTPGVVRRKKSMPSQLPRDKDTSTAEEFFIEVIIQRHARRLLQDKKLEALGYMSAALDFHLVRSVSRQFIGGQLLIFFHPFPHRSDGWLVRRIEPQESKISLRPSNSCTRISSGQNRVWIWNCVVPRKKAVSSSKSRPAIHCNRCVWTRTWAPVIRATPVCRPHTSSACQTNKTHTSIATCRRWNRIRPPTRPTHTTRNCRMWPCRTFNWPDSMISDESAKKAMSAQVIKPRMPRSW